LSQKAAGGLIRSCPIHTGSLIGTNRLPGCLMMSLFDVDRKWLAEGQDAF
jgi:hypothetical protein